MDPIIEGQPEQDLTRGENGGEQFAPQQRPAPIPSSVNETLVNMQMNLRQQAELNRLITVERDEYKARVESLELALGALSKTTIDKEIVKIVAEKRAAGLSSEDAIEVARRQVAHDREIEAAARTPAKPVAK